MDNFEIYEKIQKLCSKISPLAQEFETLLSELNGVRTFGCSKQDTIDDLEGVLTQVDRIFGCLGVVKSEVRPLLKSAR